MAFLSSIIFAVACGGSGGGGSDSGEISIAVKLILTDGDTVVARSLPLGKGWSGLEIISSAYAGEVIGGVPLVGATVNLFVICRDRSWWGSIGVCASQKTENCLDKMGVNSDNIGSFCWYCGG
ncbi:MAG: hypothetical protein IT291_00610 [Deltaproteobacteria bacterium]|nr:hypothetical protein [Deltaproteobacteria bacterium]